jgi:hypothetical protein
MADAVMIASGSCDPSARNAAPYRDTIWLDHVAVRP